MVKQIKLIKKNLLSDMTTNIETKTKNRVDI